MNYFPNIYVIILSLYITDKHLFQQPVG